jgi:hypothetical protein
MQGAGDSEGEAQWLFPGGKRVLAWAAVVEMLDSSGIDGGGGFTYYCYYC